MPATVQLNSVHVAVVVVGMVHQNVRVAVAGRPEARGCCVEERGAMIGQAHLGGGGRQPWFSTDILGEGLAQRKPAGENQGKQPSGKGTLRLVNNVNVTYCTCLVIDSQPVKIMENNPPTNAPSCEVENAS